MQTADDDRRAAALTALRVTPGYRLPLRILRDQLELIGYAVSLDRLRADGAWLAEQGLLALDADIATLTERGEDVAAGRARVPGVRRAGAGETR